MKWFEFDQNNSGGSFDVDDQVCHKLFIQADTQDQAVDKAQHLGVYFNGVEKGLDCDCCGDRWSPPWCSVPEQESIESYAQRQADEYGWTKPDARLFYADGTVKEIFTTPKEKKDV